MFPQLINSDTCLGTREDEKERQEDKHEEDKDLSPNFFWRILMGQALLSRVVKMLQDEELIMLWLAAAPVCPSIFSGYNAQPIWKELICRHFGSRSGGGNSFALQELTSSSSFLLQRPSYTLLLNSAHPSSSSIQAFGLILSYLHSRMHIPHPLHMLSTSCMEWLALQGAIRSQLPQHFLGAMIGPLGLTGGGRWKSVELRRVILSKLGGPAAAAVILDQAAIGGVVSFGYCAERYPGQYELYPAGDPLVPQPPREWHSFKELFVFFLDACKNIPMDEETLLLLSPFEAMRFHLERWPVISLSRALRSRRVMVIGFDKVAQYWVPKIVQIPVGPSGCRAFIRLRFPLD